MLVPGAIQNSPTLRAHLTLFALVQPVFLSWCCAFAHPTPPHPQPACLRARGPAGDQFVATPCASDERLIAHVPDRPPPHPRGPRPAIDIPRSTSSSFSHQ